LETDIGVLVRQFAAMRASQCRYKHHARPRLGGRRATGYNEGVRASLPSWPCLEPVRAARLPYYTIRWRYR
jgi:hypothetical protein